MDIRDLPALNGPPDHSTLSAVDWMEGILLRDDTGVVVIRHEDEEPDAVDDEVGSESPGTMVTDLSSSEVVRLDLDQVLAVHGAPFVLDGRQLFFGKVLFRPGDVRLDEQADEDRAIPWSKIETGRAYVAIDGDYAYKYCKLGRMPMGKKRYTGDVELTLPDEYSYDHHYTRILHRLNGGRKTKYWMRPDPAGRTYWCHFVISRRSNNRGSNGMVGFVLRGKRLGS
ncbi:MAG: hypothetical protein KC485_12915 [Gemmatimonadetes bacterium]|nr:hypothetical protein [Gemmatimonadota bacterium]